MEVPHSAWKGGLSILYIGLGFLKSVSTPDVTKELYRSTVSCRTAPGIGLFWYGLLMLAASSFTVAPLAKNSGATLGGWGFHRSRTTASESKMAQIGPPPFNLFGSPLYAIAAAMKL